MSNKGAETGDLTSTDRSNRGRPVAVMLAKAVGPCQTESKLAKSVINLRAKKVPKKPAKKEGATGTIKMFVKKVMG